MKKVIYDNSQINEYRKCPMSYYIKYVRGLVKQDTKDLDTLHIDFGSTYHKFLDLYYTRKKDKTQDKIDVADIWSAFENRDGETTKTRDNGIALCKAYVKHFESIDSFEVLDVEKPITFELGDYTFIVKRDAVVMASDNVYALEHKTTGRLSYNYFSQYYINSQMSAQSYVTLNEYGSCSGVILNVAQPSFVSKAVLLAPDSPEVSSYSDVEIKYSKYYKQDMAYCSGFNCKFERDVISRSKEELEDWKENTVAWCNEIEKSKNDNRWLKNDSGWNCKMCTYRELCKMSRGTNLDENIVDVIYEEVNPLEYLNLEKEGADE